MTPLLAPVIAPAPWYQFDEQIVDRNHDPICTLYCSRYGNRHARLMEIGNAAAILAIPQMMDALEHLATALKDGRDEGIDGVEARVLFQVAFGALTAATCGQPLEDEGGAR